MNFSVRPAMADDFAKVAGWYAAIGEPFPGVRKFPVGSTLVCEIDGDPALVVAVVITNIDVAWVECFIGNPALKGPSRQAATKVLFNEVCRLAREMGFGSVFCMAPNEKLRAYYEKMGLRVSASNVFTLTKGL